MHGIIAAGHRHKALGDDADAHAAHVRRAYVTKGDQTAHAMRQKENLQCASDVIVHCLNKWRIKLHRCCRMNNHVALVDYSQQIVKSVDQRRRAGQYAFQRLDRCAIHLFVRVIIT